MDKIEKIRQEIERLKKENDNIKCDSNKAYCQGYDDAFVDLLSFLNTLSEEPELVRHPPIAYTYPSDASRDEQLKLALLALLKSDLIKVAGNKFTKQDLIDWVETTFISDLPPDDKGEPGENGILEKPKECVAGSSKTSASEDERIRKVLLSLVSNDKVAGYTKFYEERGITCDDAIAYLEKQKEAHYTKRNALFDKCVAECDPEIMQRVSDEIDEMLEKEQKPASTEDMPYITDEHFYEREPVDSFKYKLAEYMTRCCTKKEGPDGYEYGISAETILKMAEEELLKRGVVQKPAEWSEEDEKMRNLAIEWAETMSGQISFVDMDSTDFRKIIAWLKSLRPQPKEQDVEKLPEDKSFEDEWKDYYNNSLVSRLPMNKREVARHFYWFAKKNAWKPSEEQMEALHAAGRIHEKRHGKQSA